MSCLILLRRFSSRPSSHHTFLQVSEADPFDLPQFDELSAQYDGTQVPCLRTTQGRRRGATGKVELMNFTAPVATLPVYDVPSEWSHRAYLDEAGYLAKYEASITEPGRLLGRGSQAHPLVQALRPGSRTPISAPATSRSAGSRTASPTSPITASTGISTTRGDQVAIIWEGDDPAESKTITYRELHDEVCRIANIMRNRGVKKGDRVTIYMPMIPEAAYAMLACARLGAIHSVVFGGFSPDSLASRIQDAKSAFVITADEGLRGGRKVPLKVNVDAAIERVGAGVVDHVLVVRRTGVSRQHGAGPRRLLPRGRRARLRRMPLRGDERGGSALHPLHLGLDRHAEGRAAHHRRLSRLRRDDAPIRLRLPRRRHLLVHGRCRLGDGPFLHPLRTAGERRHDPDVRGRADLSLDLPLLGGDRQAQGQHLLHRPDRDPLAHAGRRGAGEARPRASRCACWARSASRSIRKPGNGTIAWSATIAARSSTPGGRPRPAAS